MATLPESILEHIVSYAGVDTFVAMNQCLKPEYRFIPKPLDGRLIVSIEMQLIVRIERKITTFISQVKDTLFTRGERLHACIDLFEYVLETLDILTATYRDLKQRQKFIKATYAATHRILNSDMLYDTIRTQLRDRFEASADRLLWKCQELLRDS